MFDEFVGFATIMIDVEGSRTMSDWTSIVVVDVKRTRF